MSLMLTLNFQEQQKFEEMSMITDLISSIELEGEKQQEYTQKHYIVTTPMYNPQQQKTQQPKSTKKEEVINPMARLDFN